MAKDIGQPGVSIPKPKTENKKQEIENLKTKNTKKPESSAFADLNFKVSQEFNWEFKVWSANHQMSQKATLEEAFELLKKSYN